MPPKNSMPASVKTSMMTKVTQNRDEIFGATRSSVATTL